MSKFTKGVSGNPGGRPKGIADKRSRLRSQLATRGPKLLKKLVDTALAGDVDSLKFLVGRLIPPARDLPEMVEAQGDSLADLSTAIVREAMAGRISPDTARELAVALSAVARTKAIDELESRLEKLESAYETTHPKT